MANKYKNEALVKIGAEEILLRPTFENLSAFESNVMTLDQFSFNLVKAKIPSMTELVKALYFFQAEKKFNLEEMNCLVQNHGGITLQAPLLGFLSKCVAGYDNAKDAEVSVDKAIANHEAEKKN